MADMYLGRRAQLEKLASLLPDAGGTPRAPRGSGEVRWLKYGLGPCTIGACFHTC